MIPKKYIDQEGDIHGGLLIKRKNNFYITGNRRNQEVELYDCYGNFIEIINQSLIKNIIGRAS